MQTSLLLLVPRSSGLTALPRRTQATQETREIQPIQVLMDHDDLPIPVALALVNLFDVSRRYDL